MRGVPRSLHHEPPLCPCGRVVDLAVAMEDRGERFAFVHRDGLDDDALMDMIHMDGGWLFVHMRD